MFLQASVILSTGGRVSASLHAGMPDSPGSRPPRTRHTTPLDQAHPPGPGTPPPRSRYSPRLGTPPPPDQAHQPLDQAHHPPSGPGTHPREADASIRSMSGRYAAYWNAFLFCEFFSGKYQSSHGRLIIYLMCIVLRNNQYLKTVVFNAEQRTEAEKTEQRQNTCLASNMSSFIPLKYNET